MVMATLRDQQAAARDALSSQARINAYTPPLLLRRFIQAELSELQGGTDCDGHEMLLVKDQTYESKHTRFVSVFCHKCLFHFHIEGDLLHSRAAGANHHGHMLAPCEIKGQKDLRAERTKYNDTLAFARFVCLADDCLFNIKISRLWPRITNSEVDALRDESRVFENLKRARVEDPDRYADVPDNYGLFPAELLIRYLTDASKLSPEEKPLKIKKRNKKFRVSFGTDFDPLLRQLGFEEKQDEDNEQCWFISKPEAASTPTPVRTLRARMQDALEELKTLSVGQETLPAWNQLIGAFQGHYASVDTRQNPFAPTPSEHDATLLGCLPDFQPPLFSWAAILLSDICTQRRTELLDAGLRCIAQRDEQASLDITMYRSRFDPATPMSQQLQDAYRFFGLDPAGSHTTQQIVDKYYAVINADSSDATQFRAIQHLESIGNYLGEDLLANSTAHQTGAVSSLQAQLPTSGSSGARDRRMSISSAARLLNVETIYSAELVIEVAGNLDEKIDREKLIEAFEVFGDLKRDQNQPEEEAKFRQTANFVRATGTVGQAGQGQPKAGDPQTEPSPSEFMNYPPGLRNIGNTCYLNSLLQYFFNVKPVHDLVVDYYQDQLELDEQSVGSRRTGGNGTSVNLEEAIVARQFIEELRALFLQLEDTTDAAAQPSQKLANTALSSAKEILSEQPKVEPPPLPARPSPVQPNSVKEDVDMVNVTVEPVNDTLETASSCSSQTLINGGDDSREGSFIRVDHGSGTNSTVTMMEEEIAPKTGTGQTVPDGTQADDDVPHTPTLEEKIAQVSSRLEQSDRSGTAQQDVEEIIGNILEHLMRAIRSEGPMDGLPDLQVDKITNIFFTTIVNCTVRTSVQGSTGLSSLSANEDVVRKEIVPERWITAFPHPDKANKVQSTLYSALDRYFSYEPLDDGLARYTTIRRLPPILHICIQRTDASGEKNKNPVIIPEALYLDRYLEAEIGSPLWETRRRVWALKERLAELETRSANGDSGLSKPTGSDDWAAGSTKTSFNTAASAQEGNSEASPMDGRMVQDITRPGKRKSQDASIISDAAGENPPKRRSLSPPPGEGSSAGSAEPLWVRGQQGSELDSGELSQLGPAIDGAFESMTREKYSLHAVICHSGRMSAGHYWVWVRDFKRNVWYKYNDATVTEDARDSQAVLDELNNSGDPYYVAYARDEHKEELVEVPQRRRQVAAADGEAVLHPGVGGELGVVGDGDGDVEMQTIEGVAPGGEAEAQAKSKIEEAQGDDPPPYEML
ncbi:hypothetical protein GGR56DRAFT_645983 [Xylariaceae sp. FL0804]|nr:hypothetical protein GGR56DRAFT_645983 [Xylariaceae sp. FL0804]